MDSGKVNLRSPGKQKHPKGTVRRNPFGVSKRAQSVIIKKQGVNFDDQGAHIVRPVNYDSEHKPRSVVSDR